MAHAPPIVEVTRVRRGRSRDSLVAAAVIGALTLAVLKPWASPIDRMPLDAPTPLEGSQRDISTAAPPAVETPIAIPAGAFDPPADACLVDGGWRVCVFGALADRQTVHSWLFSPATPAESSDAPLEPAVLLLTGEGAGLGFYSRPLSEDWAAGYVGASAWYVPPGAGLSEWVPLRLVEPVRVIGDIDGTAYRPVDAGFVGGAAWPPGRYVVMLAAGESWIRSFTFEVVGPGASSCCYGTWRKGNQATNATADTRR